MGKALVGLIVVGGIILAGMYFFGGVAGHDPTALGNAAKAKIKSGMSWEQVCDAAGEPRKYRVFITQKKVVDGEEREFIKEGAELKFVRNLFTGDMKAGTLKDGFVFPYIFSHQAAFDVTFDGGGKVIAVRDAITTADLLGTRDK